MRILFTTDSPPIDIGTLDKSNYGQLHKRPCAKVPAVSPDPNAKPGDPIPGKPHLRHGDMVSMGMEHIIPAGREVTLPDDVAKTFLASGVAVASQNVVIHMSRAQMTSIVNEIAAAKAKEAEVTK